MKIAQMCLFDLPVAQGFLEEHKYFVPHGASTIKDASRPFPQKIGSSRLGKLLN